MAETLLLHLLRGAGLDGLAAPPPRQTLPRAALGPPLDAQPVPAPLVVLRPLLAVARADTAAYCAEHGLVPVGEPPGHYQRDRLRAALLPAIERTRPPAAGRWSAPPRRWRRSARRWRRSSTPPGLPSRGARATPSLLPGGLARARHGRAQAAAGARASTELAGTDAGVSHRSLAAALALAEGQAGRGVDWPRGSA